MNCASSVSIRNGSYASSLVVVLGGAWRQYILLLIRCFIRLIKSLNIH